MKLTTVLTSAALVMLFISMAVVQSYAQTEEWRATHDFSHGATPNLFPAQDIGREIGFDAAGNSYVLVTTLAWENRLSDSPTKFVVFKYDSDGNELWQYNGGFNHTLPSTPTIFHVDPQGNVYGAFTKYYFSTNTKHDANIFKLNNDGTLAWLASWNNAATDSYDHAVALNVDADGNVYFVIKSDFSTGINPNFHPVIQKYNPFGIKLWEITGQGTTAVDIDTDDAGNVYVLQDGWIRKYSSVFGILMNSGEVNYWWDDDGLTTNPTYWASAGGVDIEVAPDGNVYVAATATQRHWIWVGPGQNDWESEEHNNFLTVKFDLNCNLLWRDEYGTYEYEEYPVELGFDNDGNILVTGPSQNQLATLKYLPDGTRDGIYLYSDNNVDFDIAGVYVYTVDTPPGSSPQVYKYLLSTGVEQWNTPVTDLLTYGNFHASPEGDLYLTGSIDDGEGLSGATASYADDMVLIKYYIPDCSDGIDNDGDDYIDYPEDPSCSGADDDTEVRCFRIWRWTICIFDRPMQVAVPLLIIGALWIIIFFARRKKKE